MSQLVALLDHVPAALLVIFRLGGLMIFGPVFGSATIPARVKVMLPFLLGIAVYPCLVARGVVLPSMPLTLWALGPAVVTEMLIGLVVGYVASIPLVAAQTGGLVMGQQMGLGFARFYNPAIDDEADVIGQVLFFMGLAGFLLIGGHEAMVLAILHSFDHVPPGQFVPDEGLLTLVTGLLLAAFEMALRVAAPLLALIFLESLAMGYMAKTVPQLNILSLGFPIRILVGLVILALGLLVIDEVLMEAIDDMLAMLFAWIESAGPVP
jgi:flagellar biosynthetic protein FliR